MNAYIHQYIHTYCAILFESHINVIYTYMHNTYDLLSIKYTYSYIHCANLSVLYINSNVSLLYHTTIALSYKDGSQYRHASVVMVDVKVNDLKRGLQLDEPVRAVKDRFGAAKSNNSYSNSNNSDYPISDTIYFYYYPQ